MNVVFFLLTLMSFTVIANPLPDDEKLMASLVESNVICKDQSYDQKLKSLQIYLSKKNSKTNKIDNSSKQTTHEHMKNRQCISAPKD